jgi:hypothetical protein
MPSPIRTAERFRGPSLSRPFSFNPGPLPAHGGGRMACEGGSRHRSCAGHRGARASQHESLSPRHSRGTRPQCGTECEAEPLHPRQGASDTREVPGRDCYVPRQDPSTCGAPGNTSNECAACGHVDEASRKGDLLRCSGCGQADHENLDATKVIKGRAREETANVKPKSRLARTSRPQPAPSSRRGMPVSACGEINICPLDEAGSCSCKVR